MYDKNDFSDKFIKKLFTLISGEKSFFKKNCVVNNNYLIHLTYASHRV